MRQAPDRSAILVSRLRRRPHASTIGDVLSDRMRPELPGDTAVTRISSAHILPCMREQDRVGAHGHLGADAGQAMTRPVDPSEIRLDTDRRADFAMLAMSRRLRIRHRKREETKTTDAPADPPELDTNDGFKLN